MYITWLDPWSIDLICQIQDFYILLWKLISISLWNTSVMRLVHAIGKTWYKELYQHAMYVICLYNISMKTNFKQITMVELKFVQYSEGDYILCMTSRYFCCSFTNVTLLCFVLHSNDMTSWQSSSAENVSCNVAPFFYHHSVVMQHLISDTLYRMFHRHSRKNVSIYLLRG
jgi:hypothetical protein